MISLTASLNFNPRSREGSDVRPLFDGLVHGISIHAPVKGATGLLTDRHYGAGNFNPRSREGSDIFDGTGTNLSMDFNPRSREGSDWIRPGIRRGLGYFNPRSREGSDRRRRRRLPKADVSIHAPVKGATHTISMPRHVKQISIHAPVKGATPSACTVSALIPNFNPRSREGSDVRRSAIGINPFIFQSTLP